MTRRTHQQPSRDLPTLTTFVFATPDTQVLVLKGACLLLRGQDQVERVAAFSVLGEKSGPRALAPELERAIALVERDLSRKWSLAELARRSGCSRATLVRKFHAELGQSPQKYFALRRLHEAAQLLQNDVIPLAEVAARVGFGSVFALGRAFKRQYGVAPGFYRRSGGASQPPTLALAA